MWSKKQLKFFLYENIFPGLFINHPFPTDLHCHLFRHPVSIYAWFCFWADGLSLSSPFFSPSLPHFSVCLSFYFFFFKLVPHDIMFLALRLQCKVEINTNFYTQKEIVFCYSIKSIGHWKIKNFIMWLSFSDHNISLHLIRST